MARFLVTGGAGFIGSHLCDMIVARGDEVVILDDLSSGRISNLAGLNGKVQLIESDINGAVEQIVGPFDAAIHLAALISGHDSLLQPADYVHANINGLLKTIELVRTANIPRAVFASSSTVYGNTRADILTEVTLPSPFTVYAATKNMGEHLLSMYGEMYGFSHCSLRFFNVYGPRQSLNHPYANVTCKFSHAAANGTPVRLFGDGGQTRDFVYVDDVVRAIVLALEPRKSRVYNIGTGTETSILDLLSTLESITGRRLAIEHNPAWPNDVRRIRADISLARAELDFEPQVTLAEGLKRTVMYFGGMPQ